MGILPSSQYGSVAVLPGVLSPSDASTRIYAYTPVLRNEAWEAGKGDGGVD